MDSLSLVDSVGQYIGIVTPLTVVDGVLMYGWSVSNPANHFQSRTGTAKSEQQAIADATSAASALGIDSINVQE